MGLDFFLGFLSSHVHVMGLMYDTKIIVHGLQVNTPVRVIKYTNIKIIYVERKFVMVRTYNNIFNNMELAKEQRRR